RPMAPGKELRQSSIPKGLRPRRWERWRLAGASPVIATANSPARRRRSQWASFALALIFALAADAALAQDKPLTIENEFLQASFDRATSHFSLIAKPSQRIFLRDGKFSSAS